MLIASMAEALRHWDRTNVREMIVYIVEPFNTTDNEEVKTFFR